MALVSGRHRTLGLALGVLSIGLLTACGPATATSEVTLTYTHDGQTHTLTAHPDNVTCRDSGFNAIALHNRPQAALSVQFDSAGDGGLTWGWVSDDVLLVLDADTVDIASDGDGRYRVSRSPGTGRLVEITGDVAAPPTADDFDTENAVEVETTVDATIVCTEQR